MSGRSAIVIAVDGLRAAALGAYGNTWHPTPALDALASRSVVVDWMYRESPDLKGFYRSAWGDDALPRGIVRAQGTIALVTDDPDVAAWGETAGITDVCHVDNTPSASALDLSDTAMAQLFAVAAETLERRLTAGGKNDFLLWIHSRGFHGAWDAPLALRQELLDEDELESPAFVATPLDETAKDQDVVLAYRAAYAAQVIVLDECVGGLLAAAGEAGSDEDALVALVGCRGFALGEHGAMGGGCVKLVSELLHIPCFITAVGLPPSPPRWPLLATTADLRATLATWLAIDAAGAAPPGVDLLSRGARQRRYIVSAGADGEAALRTPEWYLRRLPHGDGVEHAAPELYVKPDDRWEANEIAARQPEVADRLLAALERVAASPQASPFEPLPEL